jgi:methyl-galactoside transport system ATP-binding protein
MDEILRISDDITVMRDGTWVATEPVENMTMDKIIKLMVGRELTNRFPPKENVVSSDVSLSVEGMTGMYSALKDVTFEAHAGEILGIAGLDGSGRTETLETIFGVAAKKSGTMHLHGRPISNKTPKDALNNGFALLTEERRATGIFSILTIRENTTISSLKKYLKYGLLSRKKMEESTDWSIDAMHIKTPNQSTQIRSLSGGNQQKVILGRWLLTDPEILLLDEPTRGIDVGAKYEIYQLIIDLAKQGKTVLMVSSEMPELLGVCDRILVMSGGRLAGEVDARTTTQEEIMTLAAKYA